ncbi:44995_t:CDS:2 [Gigaspora margarita]|uniref:44995_t:CDS:1 n=1 Tax=Gigaspora margarita TaxID=4874 RepID=A0ABN7WYI9_GIGMA|nr:44995_t:CDS:2 [Gigaspora margarita]
MDHFVRIKSLDEEKHLEKKIVGNIHINREQSPATEIKIEYDTEIKNEIEIEGIDDYSEYDNYD